MILTSEYQAASDINRLKWSLLVPAFLVCYSVFERQYTSCMKVGSGVKKRIL